MSTATSQPVIQFPEGYEERGQYEAPVKGYLGNVVVQVEDGSRYQLMFYDPVRLEQTLTSDAEAGRCFLAEPNMVVLPEVNTEAIRIAVHALWREGYFEQIRPLRA